MRATLFFLFTFLAQSLLASTEPHKWSSDCQSWTETLNSKSSMATESEANPRSGFLKSATATIYYDFPKGLLIKLGTQPHFFVEREGYLFVFTGTSINAFLLETDRKDSELKVLQTISKTAEKMANGYRWTVLEQGKNTHLLATLMGSQKCSAEPNARAVLCRLGKPCTLGPKAKHPEKNMRLCANELGLLKSPDLEGLRRACEFVSDEKSNTLLKQALSAASKACNTQEVAPPLFLKAKKICTEAKLLIDQVK